MPFKHWVFHLCVILCCSMRDNVSKTDTTNYKNIVDIITLLFLYWFYAGLGLDLTQLYCFLLLIIELFQFFSLVFKSDLVN